MALKNRPGDRAADFSFTTGKGGHGTLYDIDADYVLLFSTIWDARHAGKCARESSR